MLKRELINSSRYSLMPFRFLHVCLPAFAYVLAPAVSAHGVETESSVAGRFLEALVIACLVAAAFAYGIGIRRLWRNAHAGAGISARQAGFFAAGWLLLAAALLSPIDTLGNELFSMHMVQHELMMLGAAPLLVAGRPLAAFIWAFPAQGRLRIGRFVRLNWIQRLWLALTRPLAAWLLHLIALWAWHFPSLFQASLESDWIHALQHASFLVSALLFWAALIGPLRGPQHRMHGAGADFGAAVYVLTTVIHTGVLGALLTFSSRIWYPVYAGRTEHWGLTLLEDQQLGGLIMWVPAGFILIGAGMLFAARAISPQGSAAQRLVQGEQP